MNSLAERIARLIAAQGPLSVAQFMTMALHDPQSGTYASRDPLGTRGDFITAPEISQVFGELLGLWCVQLWRDQGAAKKIRLMELGPGRGTLMADALRAAKLDPKFLAAVEVVLVEASPALQAVQRERLKDSGVSIRWLERFDDSLSDRPLLLLANEFFDALPIRQFVHAARGWCERMVTIENGQLAFALAPSASALDIPASRGKPEDGAVFETSPAASALTEEIARIIEARGGGALIVDYGYDNGTFGDTLQAVRDHRFTEILAEPGDADLSAHVDFTALAAAASRGGAKTFGPVAQGALLEKLGVTARSAQLQRANAKSAADIGAAIHRLVDPDKMGTLFKALAILPAGAAAPPGF